MCAAAWGYEMDYEVVLRPAAEKSLAALPRSIQARVIERANALRANPRPHGSVKLSGEINLYRIRVGDYRVVYAIDDERKLVTITIVAHRKESYRGL